MTAALPKLLDIVELAEHLGVTERHVRRLVAERRIPFIKWGHLLRFDPGEVAVWLDRSRIPPRELSQGSGNVVPTASTGRGGFKSTRTTVCEDRDIAALGRSRSAVRREEVTVAKRRQFGTIRKLPSGRWQARYRDPQTNRLISAPMTFVTRGAASQFLSIVQTDLNRGTWQDPKRGEITFAEWVERYLRIADHKAATTRSRDETVLRTHLLPVLGARKLARITPLDVQHVVNNMSKRIAPATVRTNYGVLRMVLNAAVDYDRIPRSPCRRIKLPTEDATSHRALSTEELHRFAAAMPDEYRSLVYVGGVLGLPWSELVGLRIGRVNILGRTLEVAEAIKDVSGQLVEDGLVKSKAARRVLGIPDQLAAILAEHLAQRGLTAAEGAALLFVSPKGGPLRYQNFMRRVWRPAVATAGLQGVTAHDLRHTAATYLDAVGAPEQLIRRRLGHGSSDVTRRVYIHVLDETDKAVTHALGELVWRHTAQERTRSEGTGA